MPTESEINRLLGEITKATVSSKLSWELRTPPKGLEAGTNDIFPVYMQVLYKSQSIGLYERRYKEYFSDFDSFLWTSRIGLVFIDSAGRVVWEYEEPSVALSNLFQVARESASGVDSIVSRLLGGS